MFIVPIAKGRDTMPSQPMNLLILMSDEHTRRMTGCYGHSMVQTPNLDRLAERGVRFDNAYVNHPICVPSRANFITGRYTHETGNWDNAHPYTGEEAAGFGHRLADAGHNLTTIGKLHYRFPDDPNGLSDSRIAMNVFQGKGDYYGSIRWKKLNNRWIGFFIFIALLNGIVVETQSEVFWVNFKVWGLLPISFIFIALQIPLINKYKLES